MDNISCWINGKCIGKGIVDKEMNIHSKGDTFECTSHFFDVCKRCLYNSNYYYKNVGSNSCHFTKQNKIRMSPTIIRSTIIYNNLSKRDKCANLLATHAPFRNRTNNIFLNSFG